MSLFGSITGDFDDDIFGNHMNAMNMQMRSMNRLMNSFMPDPFNMLAPFDNGFQQNAIMERNVGGPMGGLFGFPAMPNMNRLLSADIGSPNGAAYCSSSVISMSSGPDGRPQIYQATSSSKTGPGGIRETRKTVQDSTRGIKKMAIGHHIGERSHIIEKEQDLRSGQLEERQEFINLEEDEAEDFDREFTNRSGMRSIAGAARPQQMLTIEPIDDDEDVEQQAQQRQLQQQQRRQMPALPAPPQQQNNSSSLPSSTLSSSSSSALPSSTPLPMCEDVYIVNSNNNNNNAASIIYNNNNNNNNYLHTTPRRAAYRNSHLVGGVTARRPLRTPTSSPLTMTPTNHTTSPSVHPHPYNALAARRNHRSKHSKQHQQSHSTNNGAATTRTTKTPPPPPSSSSQIKTAATVVVGEAPPSTTTTTATTNNGNI